MKKIIIFSGCEYSLKNKGDLAMLQGLLSWLDNIGEPLQITAYEMTPGALSSIKGIRNFPSPEQYILKAFNQQNKSALKNLINRLMILSRGLIFVIRFVMYKLIGARFQRKSSITGFFHQLLEADALILSGGGYLNSIWWAGGLYSKLFPILSARLIGVPVILTSQGLGPFTHPVDRFVAKLIITSCTVIGIRDKDSSTDMVHSISKKSVKKILNTGDDALLVSPISKLETRIILQAEGVPNDISNIITVNLRDSSSYNPSYNSPPFTIVAAVLDDLLEQQKNCHIIFIPISYHDEDGDKTSARKVKELMRHAKRSTIINNEYSPAEIKGIISTGNISIGTSYHFLLFSLSQNIPSLALYQDKYYKQKLQGLSKMYQQKDYCFDLSRLSDNDLFKITNKLIEQRAKISDDLLKTNNVLKPILTNSHNHMINLIKSQNHE